jgi:hypothetical protein
MQDDGRGWYFRCVPCSITIGIKGITVQTTTDSDGEKYSSHEFFGKWRSAKEAKREIKKMFEVQE